MAVVSIKNKLRRGNLLVGNEAFIPNSFESIATATGTGSSNTITFSNIPQTYQHLQIRLLTKDSSSNNTGNSTSDFLRINGDTGSNYARHYLAGGGSTVIASGQDASTNAGAGIFLGVHPGNASGITNMFGVSIVDIHDYASTTKNKTIRSFHGSNTNMSTSFDTWVGLSSGVWLSTNAVTSITIYTTITNNYPTGCTFALYGIRGA